VVGDDIEADMAGAKVVGFNSVQVRTGKYQPKDVSHPSVSPRWSHIESLAVLPSWISEHDMRSE
jgi:ribonucleotide monophosphatase NagD (HAD superfamily)